MFDRIRKEIKDNMAVLEWFKTYLIMERKSYEAQKWVKEKNPYGVEIESPTIGGTDGDWIRLDYNECLLYVMDDGTFIYEYNPECCIGTEVVLERSLIQFVEAVDELPDEELEEYKEIYENVV